MSRHCLGHGYDSSGGGLTDLLSFEKACAYVIVVYLYAYACVIPFMYILLRPSYQALLCQLDASRCIPFVSGLQHVVRATKKCRSFTYIMYHRCAYLFSLFLYLAIIARIAGAVEVHAYADHHITGTRHVYHVFISCLGLLATCNTL